MAEGPKRYVVLCMFNVTTKWLAMAPEERKVFRNRCFGPILVRHSERVRPRLFDMWAFNSRATDIMMCETRDLGAYYDLMNELKETELFSGGFIERTETFMAVEDDFLLAGPA
jgi:hypothetical protein